jgi:hypothetical protein
MDGWGIGIFVLGAALYYVTGKKPIGVFISGIGLGLLIGAVWAYIFIASVIPGM